MVWVDNTSYSQGDKVRTPRHWVAKVGLLEFHVHRHLDYGDTMWLGMVRFDWSTILLDQVRLGPDLEAARTKLIELSRARMARINDILEGL